MTSRLFSRPSSIRGVTIIELLVAITVLLLVGLIGISAFFDFLRERAVVAEADVVVSFLEDARSQALSSKNASAHGVRFEAGRVVQFSGASYAVSTASTTRVFTGGIAITDISLSGSAEEVVFSRLTGKADVSGTVTIGSLADPLRSRTITIFESGIAEVGK